MDAVLRSARAAYLSDLRIEVNFSSYQIASIAGAAQDYPYLPVMEDMTEVVCRCISYRLGLLQKVILLEGDSGRKLLRQHFSTLSNYCRQTSIVKSVPVIQRVLEHTLARQQSGLNML